MTKRVFEYLCNLELKQIAAYYGIAVLVLFAVAAVGFFLFVLATMAPWFISVPVILLVSAFCAIMFAI